MRIRMGPHPTAAGWRALPGARRVQPMVMLAVLMLGGLVAIACAADAAGDLAASGTTQRLQREGGIPHSWFYSEEAETTTDPKLLQEALDAAGVGAHGVRGMQAARAHLRAAASDRSPSDMVRFAQARAVDSTAPGIGGGGDCFGLVSSKCSPCPPPEQNQAGSAGGCDLLDSECSNMFCDPLCLRTVIDCEIKPAKGQFAEIATKPVAAALCSQFKARACSKPGCCDGKDPLLQTWVEENAYGTSFPQPKMMIDACKHNSEDKAASDKICNACKKAMKGKLDIKTYKAKDACGPFEAFEGKYNSAGGKKGKSGGNDWTPTNVDFGFPFIGPHKPLKERCEGLVEEMESQLASLKSDFEEKACSCLGCCDPPDECYFPLVEEV